MKNIIKKILREETRYLNEAKKKKAKRDACYHKVKSRYKVWPSAYASAALVTCRKVGAKNWGNSTKEETLVEKRKLTKKPSSETSLRDWFKRKGTPGKTGGWVDCNTCRDGKCKPCGRSEGEKRKKPRCRPTPSACKGFKTESIIEEAEYRGRKVKLNKPTRGDVKKFKVYVKNDKGNVVKVNFGHGGTSAKKRGEKTMKIRKSNPKARKSFRARHNCDNPGPKWKARYWSCRKW
tara:strand:+ start:271 stop:975 length:705 start_codon:yes stop_codon:yes gene_type:complete